MNMAIAVVMTNGIDARNIVAKGTSLFMLCKANANIAKGGLMEPTIIAATHNTPKCRGSKPSAKTKGKNTGNVMTRTANMSIMMPAIT